MWDCALSLLAHLIKLRALHAPPPHLPCGKRVLELGSGPRPAPPRPIPPHPLLPCGKRVLELGSGTGVVGLGIARLGARRVVMTDLPSLLPLLERNAARNAERNDARGAGGDDDGADANGGDDNGADANGGDDNGRGGSGGDDNGGDENGARGGATQPCPAGAQPARTKPPTTVEVKPPTQLRRSRCCGASGWADSSPRSPRDLPVISP